MVCTLYSFGCVVFFAYHGVALPSHLAGYLEGISSALDLVNELLALDEREPVGEVRVLYYSNHVCVVCVCVCQLCVKLCVKQPCLHDCSMLDAL